MEYRDPGRPADVLWTSPPLFEPKRGPVVFRAYGPARAPVSMGMLASVDFTGLPGGAIVLLATARDGYGQRVYSQPEHTLN
ncbi:hypothetical protein ABT059_19680 [Micromonospora tulbaghiae]|uniref:hypothetical protein n=1 Tax=Micromonospora tulbaghiae TaxID=479978 RepID=UPI00331BD597